uniref:Zona pellucida sperm-binding protein 4 n=1 Tax=Astatotilapia calliptera TaxID=8154 RepID=A0AAX7V0V4_ASTCA
INNSKFAVLLCDVMVLKLTCCRLLLFALLGYRSNAQNYGQGSQNPQNPRYPPSPQGQKQINNPEYPQQPQQPKRPLNPQKPLESFHTCEVAENYRIPCGTNEISASECDAINCCFDGLMLTLQCTKEGLFIVVVARDATLPNTDLETIFFYENGHSCNPVGSTSAFAIYEFPVTACGTVVKEEPGVLIYENRMSSVYQVITGPHGSITRDTYNELLFQCRYVGTTVEALVIDVGPVPPPNSVAAAGPVRVELKLANGQCVAKGCVEEEEVYTSFYTAVEYPVRKVLRDPVYVEVYLMERTDPNFVLTLERCWATSDSYLHSLPQWDLLIDGCPYRDDRYLTTLLPRPSFGFKFPSHHNRFVFKMFHFVGDGSSTQSLYIHCDVAICQPTLGNNCEPRCFRKSKLYTDTISTVFPGV